MKSDEDRGELQGPYEANQSRLRDLEQGRKERGISNAGFSMGTLFGLTLGFLVGGITVGVISEFNPPKQVYETRDLNNDGIQDMVIEQSNGYKKPFFGIEESGKTTYITGSEVKKRNPDSILDYNSVEGILNSD
ncbi:hypothetical protein CMI42_04455 [Candidatus Pacearchaeota archaeon]|jgi:hypothetical protein|nr:hypothetical protein [Candidatus Pacearchaeota archaeon]|tara:strand:- start:1651 stop:2052 length:402 start_codon:yes stop_codon:yes gene_type:complete